MSENFYSDYLYPLQDEVLQLIDREKTGFYLTGGTALSRFYLNHRYSDDLDFFQNQSPSFINEAELLLKRLSEILHIQYGIRDTSFYKFFVSKSPGEPLLKIEFINDVKYRTGDIVQTAHFSRVDSWENILTNKLTALNRYASKDVVYILFLAYRFPINWKYIVEEARKKDAWINEINISQYLFNFETRAFSDIRWIRPLVSESDIQVFKKDLKIMARELLHGFNNSLVGKFSIP